MIVPLLGGAPAVWIVCSLCFQTLLLAGYGYVHVAGTRLGVRGQVILQLALVGAVFLVMPISVRDAAIGGAHPELGILLLLLQTIGLPFFVLSTSSPLLQRWFSELGERDPYYLYAASNAGSMLALLGYPFVVEPLLPLRAQSRALHGAFAVYAVLVVACAIGVLRKAKARRRLDAPAQTRGDDVASPAATPVGRWRERLLWIALSFAPSSLMLGATEYITTDIASVPLLWVLPLAAYLLSFIVAFAKRQIVGAAALSRALALVAALVAALTLANLAGLAWLLVGAHVLFVFLAAVVCHRALAERRPPAARLTEFYLSLSIGGMLGGLVNGLVAPFVFDDVVEYPIAFALVCLGRAAIDSSSKPDRAALVKDVGLGLGLGLVTYGLVKYGTSRVVDPTYAFVWMFGVPIMVAFAWSRRPVRYAVAIGAILLAGTGYGSRLGQTLWAHRGFFGVLKITREPEGRFKLLVSGTTMHGKQSLDPANAHVPLAYFHPTGPAGDVLGPLPRLSAHLPPRRVGVIGLGIGSLAAYARPRDEWTFFEINPKVVEVALEHFDYIKRAEERAFVDIEVGDARLLLRDGPEARFDILVLDAFSSDAIPVHLLTREALAVYRRALRRGGLLLAHVSNLHVHLPPVFAALARDANMVAIGRVDQATPEQRAAGKDSSTWVLLTDSRDELDVIVRSSDAWRPLTMPPSQSVWTDDWANLLGAMRF